MDTTTNQPISSSPSPYSGDDDPPAPDDVTFRFNQIDGNDDSNLQQLIQEAKSPSSGDDDSPAPDAVTFRFNHLQINGNDDDSKISNTQQLIPEASETDDEEEEEEDDDDDDDDDDDGDFTFMCVADNDNGNDDGSLTALETGQIRNVFPLFDQSLLLNGDYDDGNSRLPIKVPVDKVFIESPRRSPSDNGETDGSVPRLPIDVPVDKVFIESPRRSPSDNGETDGTVRCLQNESEINKSNSTGFSKLWRFRNNEMNRSNSEGRDAFVFLESSDTGTTATTSDGKPNGVKVNVGKGKGVKKGKKSTASASAHEVYLKQKGGRTEDERRRSYLPYRPGLMGFFTNVNGGLSKNVHPF